MSLHRFFLDEQVIAEETDEVFPLRLSAGDLKHARVLRLVAGEHLAVVDASRDYFECEIVQFDEGMPLVRITQHRGADSKRPRVILLQGLAKGDKLDEVIRHATELGVAEFVPLRCDRSIVKLDAKKAKTRTERWRSIAKSAAMQSGQPFVPEVQQPQFIAQLSDLLAEASAVLVCWEEAPETASLDEALARGLEHCGNDVSNASVVVVVGPEGGLSQKEVDALLASNPRAALVSLGSSILRTETAGVVAPALVLYELGQLGRRAGGARL